MKFTRLRLSGFKSFVDPTELVIEPGLTGVVGPNGCGKSNLLEAMRWVMGENRPTSMRGSGMDDVIFAGAGSRPMRNNAEVTLFIDNSDRSAPAPYNEYDSVEITRRIEREAGSVYRINGREVRQRDVQIFFADASTGSASPALVRQGQIGILINQKPLSRRAILEEAAGIAGLHQRRHEAELRLKAAETNLSRLNDVIGEVEGRNCVIMDDMVDTAGTLCIAAQALKDEGATRVLAYITHPVLSGAAIERISKSALDELVVTDTIPLGEAARACPRIRQLSVAGLLAETMRRVRDEESVSSLYVD